MWVRAVRVRVLWMVVVRLMEGCMVSLDSKSKGREEKGREISR